MHCPCTVCKNLRVFSDPTTIRSHVIVSDFVKVVYLGYKRFFVEGHRYRSKKFYNHFDDVHELHSAPVQRDGHYVFKMVRTIQVINGKKEDGKKKKRDKAPIEGVPFKKQSIFYKYLPYWANLVVRHAINGMHLKKNVFGTQ